MTTVLAKARWRPCSREVGDGQSRTMTLRDVQPVGPTTQATHVSYGEDSALPGQSGRRLPTESE